MHLFDEVIEGRSDQVELLIDADYLSYQIGGLSQSRDKPNNNESTFVCIHEEADEWRWVEPPQLVDWKVRNELEKLFELFDTERYRVYLTGEGNFREEVAVTKPYKGQRTALKPYYWQRIRDLLVNEYGAKVIEGREADDEVSIMQMSLPYATVIISNDKDLRNTPGYLYSPYRKELYRIHPSYCHWHFWKQMVTGDNIDNIPGLPGKGIKFFEKLVEKHSESGDFEQVIWGIADAYYDKDPTGALLQEQGTLLHMMRREYDTWTWLSAYTEDAPGVDDVVLDAVHLYGPYYEHT